MYLTFEQLKNELSPLFTKGQFIFFDTCDEEPYIKFDSHYTFYGYLIDNYYVDKWVYSFSINKGTGNFYVRGYFND